jgi:hypothetical protein
MCLQFVCRRCHNIAYLRCVNARRLSNIGVDPRTCRYACRDSSQRIQCHLCTSLDEASDKLQVFIKTEGGERLYTEGGAAEEASSPPAAEGQVDQHGQQQQPGAACIGAEISNAYASDVDPDQNEAESEAEGINLDHFDFRHQRPLSGSTFGSTSTAPTALDTSTVPSKRQSSGQPRDTLASQTDPEANTPQHTQKARRISNPAGDHNNMTSAITLANLSNRNAPVHEPTTRLVQEQIVQRNPNYPGPIVSPKDKSAPDSNNAPLNIGALKRTISILTFDDLTPDTRTAFPPSEATEIPPAYARPRSEVGLPPLLSGITGDTDIEEEERGAEGMRRPKSLLRGRSRERLPYSQAYLNRKMGRMQSRSSP